MTIGENEMSESKHTPGPWMTAGNMVYALMHAGWRRGTEQFKNRFSVLVQGDRDCSQEELLANARLISAAPDLLEAQTMGVELNTPDFLEWIADRLVHVHGEHPNVDYVLSLRERAKAGRAAIAKATGQA